jgi:hypothetical protein
LVHGSHDHPLYHLALLSPTHTLSHVRVVCSLVYHAGTTTASDQAFSEAFMRAVCFLVSARDARSLSTSTFSSEGLVVSKQCITNLVWLCANDVLVTDVRSKVDLSDPLKFTPVDTVRYFAARMLQSATASHLIVGSSAEVGGRSGWWVCAVTPRCNWGFAIVAPLPPHPPTVATIPICAAHLKQQFGVI